MFKSRISKVQKYLIDNNYDAFIFFLNDDHGSEYIIDSYKSIAFLCGFTGSNGTLLISKNDSYLWTDGRYFLQANNQLKESNTKLMKIGIDISLNEFISLNYKSIVLDFKLTNVSFVNNLLNINPHINLIDNGSLINSIWENRPKIKNKKVFLLEESAISKSIKEKCHKTLNYIKSKSNYAILVSALDDIAYLLNSRGFDIKYNPVFLSFLLLTKINNEEKYYLYINKNKLSQEIINTYTANNIIIKKYNDIYQDVKNLKVKIYFDINKTNYKLFTLMNKKKDSILYPSLAKSIKTSIDIKQTKKVHIKDGIAMCKLLYYIKSNVTKNRLSELSVSNYLYKLRKNQGALSLSFNTICGYKENGAIIHYSATKATNKKIYNDGFLLIDSGGQYLYGTTDITRTIALNNITDEMKKHFTLVLKAHIDLAMAIFDKNTTDAQLDKIARKPLWDNNLDYNHGTGHGIGHLLNVHEGPQSIRYNKINPIIMKKSMITSNEPGLYIENKYGIRHENELLCIKKKDKLAFETITYVPFDINGIDVSLLDENERNWLNNYHKLVYKKINKFLTLDERKFLKDITKEI